MSIRMARGDKRSVWWLLPIALATLGCTWTEGGVVEPDPANDDPNDPDPNDPEPNDPEPKDPEPIEPGTCLVDESDPPLEYAEPPDGCDEVSTPAVNLADHGCVTVSESAESSTFAFDDNTGTKWEVSRPSAWIAYDFPDGQTHEVVTYRISASNGDDRSTDPANWELQGSNDEGDVEAAEWTTVDARDGEEFERRFHTNEYSVENPGAFRRYRLVVQAAAGAEKLEVAEVELFGVGTPVLDVDSGLHGEDEHEFDFSSYWSGHTDDPYSDRYDGSTSWSVNAGDFFTMEFVGSQVRVYGVLDPKHGIMGLSVNGGEETDVDLYHANTHYNELVYTSPRFCPGRHTLRGVVTGRRNTASSDNFISIDRVQVIP